MIPTGCNLLARYDLILFPVVEIEPVGVTDHPEIMIPVFDDLLYTTKKNGAAGINQGRFKPFQQFHVAIKF